MEVYKALSGNSGVLLFDIHEDSITIWFNDGAAYEYTYASTGPDKIERMKMLAKIGKGLNTYINRYVKKNYWKKIH